MGFFDRFFKKIEAVNKEEVAVAELESEFYLESALDEANQFWVEIAQNLIVNAVKATMKGMSLEEVESILGIGEFGGDMTTPNATTETYWYEGVSGGSAQLIFYNGTLGMKEEFGLQ
ncbi:hypothetical protein [Lysinibacillus sp. FSL W7-1291]|uniref:hypothetical protein n=1 Tax=Lysinibacillus sp. FSL W7-1291 TaxID=2954544 RepID=UPI00315B3199